MGDGQLTLGGAGSWTGGTIIEGGKVTLDNASSIMEGTNLTVAGDPQAFGPLPRSGRVRPNRRHSIVPAAVPEPGTMALLAAAASLIAFRALRRRKK